MKSRSMSSALACKHHELSDYLLLQMDAADAAPFMDGQPDGSQPEPGEITDNQTVSEGIQRFLESSDVRGSSPTSEVRRQSCCVQDYCPCTKHRD